MKLSDALAEQAHQPVTVRCLHCAWTWEGICQDAPDAHRQHREKAHGIFVTTKRRRSNKSPWRSADKPLWENIEKARKDGAATWAGPQPEKPA